MRRAVFGLLISMAAGLAAVAPAGAQVLRVGSFKGVRGQFSSIQAAVSAAKPGDVILVGPGDYKTTSSHIPKGSGGEFPAGVLITTPNLILRGMNRNAVVVDGTKAGPTCNDIEKDQNFGPKASGGPAGLNGVMVWKANNVSVENMTACNFLGGSGGDGGTGNEFWWNGGADSGKIGGWGYTGSYLNATSSWYNTHGKNQVQDEVSAAEYGIFSSNWDGGTWNNTYASNMNDSGYYIGACQQECNQVINKGWAEFSALGYSGSNSGGSLVVKNSQFDNNEDGFDTNSQNGDNPPPQNGACPNNGISPITHTHSCWVFMDNNVHDNNNPNVPAAGSAAAGPVGTGMTLSGARDDTVMDNTFANNKAWGMLMVPYLDSGKPCTGGVYSNKLFGKGSCEYEEYGDALLNNKFTGDGGYGNKTNGAFDQLNFFAEPTDCFRGNTDSQGLSADAAALQKAHPLCSGKDSSNINVTLLNEVLCDTQVSLPPFGCKKGDHYPRMTKISNGLHPLPVASKLPSMPNVCGGVTPNPWCNGEVTKVKGCAPKSFMVPLSLDPGERFESIVVRFKGKSKTYKANGHSATVMVNLQGAGLGNVKVTYAENIKVGSRAEKVTFARVYHRC